MTSALTWQQLRDVNLMALDDAADGWAAVSRQADAAQERVDGDMDGALSKTQESESAKAAARRFKRLSANYDYIKTECGLIRTAVSGLSAELAPYQRTVKDALAEAEALSYTVHKDGSVSYPAGGKNQLTGEPVPGGTVAGNSGLLGPGNDGLHSPAKGDLYQPGAQKPGLINPNPHHAKAQEIADRIARALRQAHETDERYRSALSKLKAAPGLTVDRKTWADAAADVQAVRDATYEYLKREIPLDKSPADRKQWWDHLSDAQREEYLASYPDVIGNLDGIPAVVRDEANRENLQLLIAKLEGQDREQAKARLGGLKEIQHQLEVNAANRLTDPKEPPMYILGLADEGTGRAVVAFGNPDSSKNVSAYVPGLGTALDDEFARNDVKRARDTAIGARDKDPSSASIVWLGYDPPQLGGVDASTLLSNSEVMSAERAEKGAPAYNSFMSGLAATNSHGDPHLTAIGHSYGSRLVGAATQEPGGIPDADDIVLLGSPGVGVDKAEHLGVPKGHVFVGAADNDPVTQLPSKQEAVAGGVLSGAGPLVSYVGGDIADQGDDDIWFGKDPASEAFGAHRIKVDDGPRPLIDGQGPTPAHSNYFNPEVDPESAANVAAIVAGHPELVTSEKHR
ncbi:alpha/beta hydrolase [Streptomyces sp. DH24]|uniref:alpha/beta hydrolase n=1 Tax=Streptomyces sp. DH24 TaxID=3040123 RepID=UPI0024435174|nr:alpha/beta hydrolase [Streptomyces sp. DH24]MDG9716970.1 alpha/beta hydrolase [Streptomyces sp. DH24]